MFVRYVELNAWMRDIDVIVVGVSGDSFVLFA